MVNVMVNGVDAIFVHPIGAQFFPQEFLLPMSCPCMRASPPLACSCASTLTLLSARSEPAWLSPFSLIDPTFVRCALAARAACLVFECLTSIFVRARAALPLPLLLYYAHLYQVSLCSLRCLSPLLAPVQVPSHFWVCVQSLRGSASFLD